MFSVTRQQTTTNGFMINCILFILRNNNNSFNASSVNDFKISLDIHSVHQILLVRDSFCVKF